MSNSTPLLATPQQPNSSETSEKVVRSRRGRKTKIKMPVSPPVPLKSLWEWATPTQKEQAHLMATCLMEYWMGQATKKQIAEKLKLPPIRVWQLSQQATCGMVVGLLTQPKTRSQMKNSPLDPLNDPKLLHAQIT